MSQEFNVIRSLLRKGVGQTPLNATWQKLHDEHGIGRVDRSGSGKGTISFTMAEREFLRKQMIRDTGIDPLGQQDIPVRRIDAASIGRYEKRAKQAVFSNLIRVARAGGGTLFTANGEALVPPGTLLQLPVSDLSWKDETVVIIENGESIREWSRIPIPAELNGALLIYRGNDQESADLHQRLKTDPPKTTIGFYDCDPAGFLMALSNGYDAIIIPKAVLTWGPGHELFRRINQPNQYWLQVEQLRSAKGRASREIAQILKRVEEANIAVMQEHLLAHSIELTLIRIK